MAKEIVQKSQSFTRKMAINIGTGKPLQDCAGDKIIGIQAAAIVRDLDKETGEIKDVAVLVDEDGMLYSSISSIVMDVMPDVIELVDDGEQFDCTVTSRKSRGGRDFINLIVI